MNACKRYPRVTMKFGVQTLCAPPQRQWPVTAAAITTITVAAWHAAVQIGPSCGYLPRCTAGTLQIRARRECDGGFSGSVRTSQAAGEARDGRIYARVRIQTTTKATKAQTKSTHSQQRPSASSNPPSQLQDPPPDHHGRLQPRPRGLSGRCPRLRPPAGRRRACSRQLPPDRQRGLLRRRRTGARTPARTPRASKRRGHATQRRRHRPTSIRLT